VVKVLDPGHQYVLGILDEDLCVPVGPLVLQFVKREGSGYPGNEGHYPGTTMQEVMRALIDRCKYVNGQIPCAETEAVMAHLRSAILLLEVRAAWRHGRHLGLSGMAWIEDVPTCSKCGHIGCKGGCHGS
jgi:hypothetical protein